MKLVYPIFEYWLSQIWLTHECTLNTSESTDNWLWIDRKHWRTRQSLDQHSHQLLWSENNSPSLNIERIGRLVLHSTLLCIWSVEWVITDQCKWVRKERADNKMSFIPILLIRFNIFIANRLNMRRMTQISQSLADSVRRSQVWQTVES